MTWEALLQEGVLQKEEVGKELHLKKREEGQTRGNMGTRHGKEGVGSPQQGRRGLQSGTREGEEGGPR